MRLGKALDIVNQFGTELNIKESSTTAGTSIDNARDLREKALALSSVSALTAAATNVANNIPYTSTKKNVVVGSIALSQITNSVKVLNSQVEVLRSVLIQAVVPSNEETVYLKIPNVRDLSELGSSLSKIQNCFNQLFAGQENSSPILFKGVESGSSWIVLVVGKYFLDIFLKTMSGAMDVGIKFQNFKKEGREYEKMGLENSLLEQKIRFNEEVLKLVSRQVAEKLMIDYGKDPSAPASSEELMKFTRAIGELGSIFAEGSGIDVPQITHKNHQQSAEMAEQSAIQLENASKDVLLLPKPETV